MKDFGRGNVCLDATTKTASCQAVGSVKGFVPEKPCTSSNQSIHRTSACTDCPTLQQSCAVAVSSFPRRGADFTKTRHAANECHLTMDKAPSFWQAGWGLWPFGQGFCRFCMAYQQCKLSIGFLNSAGVPEKWIRVTSELSRGSKQRQQAHRRSWHRYGYLPIKPARPSQSGVQHIGPVGCSHYGQTTLDAWLMHQQQSHTHMSVSHRTSTQVHMQQWQQ